MGDMADDFIDYQCFGSLEGRTLVEKLNEYWIMKDGTKILYSDMSDSHLDNCIALVKRRGKINHFLDIEKRKRKKQNEKK